MSFQSASIFNACCYPFLQDRLSLAYYFHKLKQGEKSNIMIIHQQGHASCRVEGEKKSFQKFLEMKLE